MFFVVVVGTLFYASSLSLDLRHVSDHHGHTVYIDLVFRNPTCPRPGDFLPYRSESALTGNDRRPLIFAVAHTFGKASSPGSFVPVGKS